MAKEDIDWQNFEASQSQHPEDNNESNNSESEPQEGKDQGSTGFMGRIRDKVGLGENNSKNSPKKDIENIVGAAEGNPLAIARILKDPKRILPYALLGSPIFWIIFWTSFILMLVLMAAAGSSASITNDKDYGLCKKISGVNLPKEITDQLNKPDYQQALSNAEKVTGTSHFLIEAVDYEDNKLGTSDPGRDTNKALIDIGNRVQMANYARSSDGSLAKDSNGNPIKDLPSFTGAIGENFGIIKALANYNCVYNKHKDVSSNLDDPGIKNECFGAAAKNSCIKNALSDPWMVNPPIPGTSSSIGGPVDPNNMGALMFYVYVNQTKVCATSGGSGGTTCSGPSCPDGQKAVDLAKKQLGHQYTWGGPGSDWSAFSTDRTDLTFDCSGLVSWSWYWASGGKVSLLHSSCSYLTDGRLAPVQGDLQPGDILVFPGSDGSGCGHTGMYIGGDPNNNVIHASWIDICGPGCGILTAPLSSFTVVGKMRPKAY